MKLGKSNWRTYWQGIQKEWLVTNGIGGYSCSTIIGANARRYHGLLIAACNPPVERYLTISKLDEIVCIGDTEHSLSAFEAGGVVHEGYRYSYNFV